MRRTREVDQAAVERVETELVAAEANLDERAQAHERLLAEVAADVALGAVTADEAAATRQPSAEALDLARERVESLRRAVPVVRERWQQTQAEQAEREAQAAAKRLSDGCRAANDLAKKLARKLREADQAADALVRQREQVDRLAETSRTSSSDRTASVSRHLVAGDGDISAGVPRRRAGRIAPPDGWLDEPPWDDALDMLRDVLQGGPRRPLHEAEVEARRKQTERERQEAEVLNWVRHHPNRAAQTLARDDLSEALRREIEQIRAEVIRSAALARSTADAERER